MSKQPHRIGHAVLSGKRLKIIKLAILAPDVHETDFGNIKKATQLGVFGFPGFLYAVAMLNSEGQRTAVIPVAVAGNRENLVDAACSSGIPTTSRPAGPLLSFGRVTHTSAGIFLPWRHSESKEVAA
jgi:hypothetical protein